VEKIADSLITAYKTKSGRTVYNGSGIYPDVFVKPVKYNLITQTLAGKYYIFDYATNFRNLNSSISNAKNFRLSDSEYESFVSYLSNKDYNYSTTTERILTELQSEAERENKLAEIKTEFEALKSKVFYSKKNDLSQFKEEIRIMLENEIVSRYYFQKGRLEHGFQYDDDLKAAIGVIGNKTTLASILQGQGTYRSIGKPGEDFSANSGK
jgi:carboxyl-terminal processing protease